MLVLYLVVFHLFEVNHGSVSTTTGHRKPRIRQRVRRRKLSTLFGRRELRFERRSDRKALERPVQESNLLR